MPTYTLPFGNGDDGHLTSGGVFVNDEVTLVPGDGQDGWLGITFDLLQFVSVDSERGLRLDPPQFQKIDLVLTPTSGVVAGATMVVQFVNNPAWTQFNSIGQPGGLVNFEELQVSSTTIGTGIANNPVTVPVLPDYAATNLPTSATQNLAPLTTNQDKLRMLLMRQDWNGRLGLSIQLVAADFALSFSSSTGSNGPTLPTTETAFHTGHYIGGGHRGRARHCPKSGRPIATGDLVEDGWFEGLLVEPEWFEPRDTQGEFELPDSEGDIDDEASF